MNLHSESFAGLIDLVRSSVAADPNRLAFTFLSYPSRAGAARESNITIGELDSQARSIAAGLRGMVGEGERALLMFRPGNDFVAAFLACLYAKVVAVPSAAPRHGLGAARVNAIVRDSGAAIVLSTTSMMHTAREQLDSCKDTPWLLVDEVAASVSAWIPTPAGRDDLALLQYSSGSTGTPKGVMISHGNLIHQADLLYSEVGAKRLDCWVAWIPVFHDMGLISAVVAPLVKELHSVYMAPESFILRPVRWLKAMSRFQATCCSSPNFAYDLCTRKILDEDLAEIDLSSIRFAINGAEPIRAGTLDQFVERFSKCGFQPQAFYPAYGLAEATLLVTGGRRRDRPVSFAVDSLDQGIAVEAGQTDAGVSLVASGTPQGGSEIRIVDPESLMELPASQVGEIWVAGDGVALGYWGASEEVNSVFSGKLGGESQRSYLRTGDLGFLHDGELYVRGRLKDLIIIRGSNHHAPDLEQTAEAVDSVLASSSCAAFSVDVDDEERLVIIAELDRDCGVLDEERVASVALAVRQAITERHQLSPYAVLLLANGLPKTSSGKVRRLECRARYIAGTFAPRFCWTQTTDATLEQGTIASRIGGDEKAMRLRIECELWLLRTFSAQASNDQRSMGPETPLNELGLGDAGLIATIQGVQRHFGLAIPYTVFSQYGTVGELAEYLAESIENEGVDQPENGGRLLADALAAQDNSVQPNLDSPVAIIGIACRFPSADGPRQFWENICAGVDAVGDIPAERWDGDALYDENPLAMGKMNTRQGGFLKGVEDFDARFFGLPTREATRMDPAHRVLLELSWEVFEDAGIVAESVSGAGVGVYIGISGSDYAQLQFGDESLSNAHGGVGCTLANSACRISHFHNLRGPALAIDTACSSSLSAMQLGCTAIRTGECDMVLAGGVNIILAPIVSMSLSKAGMMAPDGRCKTFDKDADGYVRSEGAGLVLLKPLAKALADGDPIYAVIRGSATNQDGKSSAIAAPNGEAQQRVILSACDRAGVHPGMLDYIEAHGTGTALGDPIEVNALGEVVKIGAEPGSLCMIGSVKTNIGHCESAAGVASFIKAAMILDRKMIPPSLHFNQANPLIPFDDYRVRVQTQLTPLPARGRQRLVGVNSFGIGGTNVHFVLEEMPSEAPCKETQGVGADSAKPYILPLSAKTEKSLNAMAQLMADWLSENVDGISLDDLCYTLTQRRSHLHHRLAVVGASAAELSANLGAYLVSGNHPDVFYGCSTSLPDDRPTIAFVFSGHGSQWWAMGRQLYEAEAVYRDELARCNAHLHPYTGWDVVEVLMANEVDSLLGETAFIQPVLFAMQLALVALLRSWGVTPDAVVGHSFGEVAAAFVAGALTLDDACRLIAVRARLMQATKGNGRMVSIEMSRAEVEAELLGYGGELSISVSNGPSTIVVSGPYAALERLTGDLRARGVLFVELELDHAFHSELMEDAKCALANEISAIRPLPPMTPFMSTVTAQWCEGTTLLDHNYWGDNLRKEVRFSAAIEAMARQGSQVFIEFGAHPILCGAIGRTLNAAGLKGSAVATLQKNVDDYRAIMRSLARVHTRGRSPDWSSLQPAGNFVRGLPQYQWDRQRLWLDAPHLEARLRMSTHPLVSVRMPVAQPTWQSRLDNQSHPYLSALRLRGEVRLANGLFVEIAIDAGMLGEGILELGDLEFREVGLLDAEALPTIQTTIHRHGDGRRTACVAAQVDNSGGRAENWNEVLTCQLGAPTDDAPLAPRMAVESMKSRYSQKFTGADTYRKLGAIGVEYGTAAQVASEVWVDERSALLQLRLPELMRSDAGRYHLHPLVFEAMEQACRIAAGSGISQARLRHIRRLRVRGPLTAAAYAYSTLIDPRVRSGDTSDDAVCANLWILDGEGNVLAIAEDLCLASNPMQRGDEAEIPVDIEQWRYRVNWLHMPIETLEANAHDRPGHWAVFVDHSGTGDEVCRWLEARGETCVVIRHGDAYEHVSSREFVISPNDSDHFSTVIEQAFVKGGVACKGVVHLWSLDSVALADTTRQTLANDCALGVLSVTDVVRGLSSSELQKSPRLWIVTRNAQRVGNIERPVEVAQSLVWGCAKSIVLEHAELRCCRIDLDYCESPSLVTQLCEELLADRIDDQVAFRDGNRYVAQLGHATAEADQDVATNVDLIDPANARSLCVRMTDCRAELVHNRRRSPSTGSVEVRIEVASMPGGDFPQHGDLSVQLCTGYITRLGAGVTSLCEDQRVLILEAGLLSSYRVVSADAVVPMPDDIGMHDAAASAWEYFAAMCALRQMTTVTRADHVLVRIGKSGAGMIAIRVAKWLGAKVYVEAASEWHEQIHALKVAHLFDESDPSAYISAKTLMGDRGIDVLINYASNLDSSACLALLCLFGKCIEMNSAGPSGVLHSRVPSNVSTLSIDVDRVVRERGKQSRELMAEVLDRMADGTFPTQEMAAFPLSCVGEIDVANMARGFLLTMNTGAAAQDSVAPVAYRGDGTYVLSGGLGGLGLHIAARMARDGARHIALLGRRPPSLEAMDVIAELEAAGVQCMAISVDVADEDALRTVLDDIRHRMPPIRGVLHAAGVLGIGLLVQLDHSQIRSVMPAKVDGAWNFHLLTATDELDFFVMFSSLASFIGSPGQSNYAAANAFLDALAEHRASIGKPGLSIAWGPWAEAGMAADVHNLERLAQHGMGMLSLDSGMNLLEDLIIERKSGAIGALPMNWATWGRTRGYAALTPYFAGLVPQQSLTKGNAYGKITALSIAGLSVDEQLAQLQSAVLRAVCKSMLLDAESVELDVSLTAIGLDSIVALELKDRIESSIDVVVRTNALITGKSIRSLAEQFREELNSVGAGGGTSVGVSVATPSVIDSAAVLESMDDLTPAEIASLLRELTTSVDVEAEASPERDA
jgi:acyl transferase domain-containing protein/acyl-CoA synthetase (AMP-forming)/AMP-acid ligase II/NADPH:quinone reductase-like Zn-dependent oxidoreductase/acyl carrier protein